MKCFSVLAVCIVVLAVACSCNALYHFKQKLPNYCDLKATINMYNNDDPAHYLSIVASAHGTLFYYTYSFCETSSSKCTLSSTYVIRPDLAKPNMAAKMFLADSQKICQSEDLDKERAPHSWDIIDGYFVNREAAVFRGKKCYKFYNETDSPHYFADDSTGTLYGYRSEGMDYVYSFSSESHSPSNFAFKPTEQPNCDKSVYTVPDQNTYNHACDKAPKASFLFQHIPFMMKMMKKH